MATAPHAPDRTPNAQPATDSGAFLVDTVPTCLYFEQSAPALASDGRDFLAVWVDERTGYQRIMVSRLDSSGQMMDPGGFEVSAGDANKGGPTVAYSAGIYIVGWNSLRNVMVSRVSRDGHDLDSVDIRVTDAGLYAPAIAAGDSCFLMAWLGRYYGIFAARVALDGTLLDSTPVRLDNPRSAYQQPPPRVAFLDGCFLVAWQQKWPPNSTCEFADDVFVARVREDGTVLDSTSLLVSASSSDHHHQAQPMVAAGDDCFLVAWPDDRLDGDSLFWAARVSTAGELLDSSAICLWREEMYPRPFPKACALTAGHGGFLLAWEDRRSGDWGVHAMRLAGDGTLADTDVTVVAVYPSPPGNIDPSVAANARGWLVGWRQPDPAIDTVSAFLRRYNRELQPIDTAYAMTGPVPAFCVQLTPDIAAGRDGFLAVWTTRRCRDCVGVDIAGMRLTLSGTPADSQSFAVSGSVRPQWEASVAAGDSGYLVAWMDYRYHTTWYPKIYCARVTSGGAVLDPDGIQVSYGLENWHYYPAVGYGGDDYLVLWGDDDPGANFRIRGRRVSLTGQVIWPGALIPTYNSTTDQSWPAVAFGGSDYLVVWQTDGSGDDICGARVTPGCVVIDSSGFVISNASGYQRKPAVAYGVDGYFVAWMDYRTSWWRICGARVDRNGQLLDPDGIELSWGSRYEMDRDPDVVFDGSNWVVVWQSGSGNDARVLGAVVNPHGSVVDSFEVDARWMYEGMPAIATHSLGTTTVLYSAKADSVGSVPFDSSRIWAWTNDFPSGLAGEHREPAVDELLSVTPNPSAGHVRFALGATSGRMALKLTIHDAAGRAVRSWSEALPEVLVWDRRDERGRKLPTGVYFARLSGPGWTRCRQVVLTR